MSNTACADNDESIVKWIREHTEGAGVVVDLGAGRCNYTMASLAGKNIAVEIFEPYLEAFSSPSVMKIHGDMRKFDTFIKDEIDCAMMIDSLEHIDHAEGEDLIGRLKKQAKKVIIFAPVGVNEQIDDAWGMSNPHQEHLSSWYPAELEALGFVVTEGDLGGGPPVMFAVWSAE